MRDLGRGGSAWRIRAIRCKKTGKDENSSKGTGLLPRSLLLPKKNTAGEWDVFVTSCNTSELLLQYQCSKDWVLKDTKPFLKSVLLLLTQAKLPQTSPKSSSCCLQQLSLRLGNVLPGCCWNCRHCQGRSVIAARLSSHGARYFQSARLLPSDMAGQQVQAVFWFALKRTWHISGWHKIPSASQLWGISLSERGLSCFLWLIRGKQICSALLPASGSLGHWIKSLWCWWKQWLLTAAQSLDHESSPATAVDATLRIVGYKMHSSK